MEPFLNVIGETLRRARQARGLTLRDVQARSRGGFKPSALGSYERGERMISLERFCELAAIYGVPADRLLCDVLDRAAPDARREVVIDLNRLALLRGEEGRLVAEYVHKVKVQRGDYLTDVVTLRSGDLQALALEAGLKPRDLSQKLKPTVERQGSSKE